jgi:hypothetical protein
MAESWVPRQRDVVVTLVCPVHRGWHESGPLLDEERRETGAIWCPTCECSYEEGAVERRYVALDEVVAALRDPFLAAQDVGDPHYRERYADFIEREFGTDG